MKRVRRVIPGRECDGCGRPVRDGDLHWLEMSGETDCMRVMCDHCMRAEVEDFAQRTIMGMLGGDVEVHVNGLPVRVTGANVVGQRAVKAEEGAQRPEP